ncbi:MAG: shikimate dehydrogenase [Deltaproteobacteria bacterium]|nr:shikimate dehydrogenase [Deltaproteobacteria bacterium]
MSKPDPNIGAATALCGIVLHPAGHTRSPAMHNAAFGALGLDAAYLAFDVPPERLGDAIAGVRALGLRQVAVSIPHKENVMQHLDRIDETAAAIGAVNTVTRRGDELVGSNTDWTGALRALEREIDPKGRRAVVLGAGGAARAVVYALLHAGAEVMVLNRTEARARVLSRALSASGSGSLADLADLPHDILVNTTAVGLRSAASPVPAEHLRAESVVMDAVYEPEQTRLLADAEARGARPLGGKWMLVHQAAEQVRLWTERDAPIAVMAAAFDAAGSKPE